MKSFKLIRKSRKDLFGEILRKRKPSILARNMYVRPRYSITTAFPSFLYMNMSKPEDAPVVVRRPKKRKMSFFAKRLLLRRQFFAVYGFYRLKSFRKFLKNAVKGSAHFNAESVLFALESRLCVLVYRLGFVSSILRGISLVKQGVFIVNKEIVVSPNFVVQVGDFIEVSYTYRYAIYRDMFLRRRSKILKVLCPKYLEVNYRHLGAVLYRKPALEDIPGFYKKFPKNYLLEEWKAG